MFRRRKREDVPAAPDEDAAGDGEFVDDLDEQDRAYEDQLLLAELEEREAELRRPSRPQGPWDVEDVPDDGVNRLDLGGLLVPVPDDAEVRVDVSPEGEVVAATLVRQGGALQVNAFAAPRSEGIWQEVLGEIAASLRDSGGVAEQVEGAYGPELRAAVPTEVPEHGLVLAPARFVGVDGPRWFLRALFTGAAAVDEAVATPLEAALRDVVVVRGSEPMAVRDALPLRLPPQVQPADDPADGDDDDHEASGDALQMPERGPEITETR